MKIFNISTTGYRFNRLFFLSIIAIMIGLFFINLQTNGYEQHLYINCEDDVCINPLIATETTCSGIYCPPIKCEESWCFKEYLTRGEYGQKPSFIQNNFAYIGWGLVLLAILLNHLIYNRGVKFSIPTKRKLLPDWMAKLIKKVSPNYKNEIDFKDFKGGDEE